jgi:hypothetical protein
MMTRRTTKRNRKTANRQSSENRTKTNRSSPDPKNGPKQRGAQDRACISNQNTALLRPVLNLPGRFLPSRNAIHRYGDAAAEGDVWFRVLTEESYIRKGRIHHSAFTGRAIAKPDAAKSRSWSHELSGRLRSRSADDILPAAIAYCEEVSENASPAQHIEIGVPGDCEGGSVSTCGLHSLPLPTRCSTSQDGQMLRTTMLWCGNSGN